MGNEEHCYTIERTEGWGSVDLNELWEYRELIWLLSWRDITSRYRQTVLGILWAVAQPLVSVLTLTVVLNKFAKVPSDGVPYPLFSFAGWLCWQYLATVFVNSVQLSGSVHLMTKVYFPRLVIPISILLPPLFEALISLILYLIILILWNRLPSLNILWFPVLTLVFLAMSLAVTLWVSALVFQFRDLKHALPLCLQLWMFSSPVLYSSSAVPPEWRMVYYLNPMACIIDCSRWCFLGTPNIDSTNIATSLSVVVLALITGVHLYNRVSRRVADIL